MRKMLVILAAAVLVAVPVFAQHPADDLQKVQSSLLNYVVYSQTLEDENMKLRAVIQMVQNDLQAIDTKDPKKAAAAVDSLRVAYKIETKKEE